MAPPSSEGLPQPPSARRNPWWLALLGLATLLVYSSVPSFDFTNYDDPNFVVDPPQLVRGITPGGLRWALEANLMYGVRDAEYWQPVTSVSRQIDHALFGRNPAGHHAQSLLIHIINVWLVFLLLRRLGATDNQSGCFALIFALHPINVEVVCWLAARKDLLCGTGSLLTLLAYVRFARQPTLLRYLAALGAYLVALAAKPSAIALPLALLLLDVWPLGRLGKSWTVLWSTESRRAWTVIAEKLPFLLMAILLAGITFISQQEVGGIKEPVRPLLVRLGEAANGYLDYLRLFFWSNDFCVLYPFDLSAPDTLVALSAICILAAITVFAIAARVAIPAVLLGWIWFLGLLSPLMGLVPFGRQSVADRYMYIPQLGLVAMLAWLFYYGLGKLKPALRRPVSGAAAILLCTTLGLVTYRQSQTWRDSEALWVQGIKVDPGSGVARINYAQALTTQGRMREAEYQLRSAGKTAISPVEFRQSLGLFLILRKRFKEAVPVLEQAIQIDPLNMRLHSALITALTKSGQTEAATRAVGREEAIRGRVFLLTGVKYLEEGEWALAADQFRAAWTAADGIELSMHRRPELAPAADWVSRAEGTLQRIPRGDGADMLLRGLIYSMENRWQAAEQAFAALLQIKPANPEARWRRAVALRRVGRIDEANAEFAAASSSTPSDFAMNKAWEAAAGK